MHNTLKPYIITNDIKIANHNSAKKKIANHKPWRLLIISEKRVVNYLETKEERERNSDQNRNSDQESLSVNKGCVNPREEQNGVG